MTRSKNNSKVKAEASRDQRYEFAIGPAISWFLPHSADIWSADTSNEDKQPAWFIYGARSCFCYGRISSENARNKVTKAGANRSIVALTDHIEYIKNDNSRVISCKFCKKQTNYPYAFILTDNGNLTLYDCVNRTIILRFAKHEIINKVSEKSERTHDTNEQPSAKKFKFSIHISSICWPDLNNAFLSVSMSKEETSLVVWLKIPDSIINSNSDPDKNLIEFVQLKTSVSCADIVCMETLLLKSANMVYIAVGFENGMINIIKLNKESGSCEDIIVLKKHSKPICSLSLWSPESEKHEYSSGILASVSRCGLVLLWDLNNEYCFADLDLNLKAVEKFNWFACRFYALNDWQLPFLAVSNSSGGLVNLEMPKKIHPSKRPLNGKNVLGTEGLIKHRSLVFNVTFDLNSSILMTTSLDNNIIFWDCGQKEELSSNKKILSRIDPCYFLPTMPNNSRTHKIRFSPIANDHLATALGEAGLCFYRVPSERKEFRFHMTKGCSYVCYEIKRLKLTPTSIAWQPNHEYRLAVGTREGLVLRLDISNNGLVLQSLPHQTKKPIKDGGDSNDFDALLSENDQKNATAKIESTGVYSLCWGPNPLDRQKTAIYSVTSQKLAIYTADDEKFKENLRNLLDTKPEIFSNIEEFCGMASEVSWKSDFDLMAFGATDGRVLIIKLIESKNQEDGDKYCFEKLVTIKDIFTSIQALAWHPTTYNDSEYYYYLAVAPKEIHNGLNGSCVLHLFDLRSKIPQNNSQEEMDAHVTDSDIKLVGHTSTIAEISWSPHQENHLCSCSFDARNIVWSIDVDSRTHRILSQFVARDRLFTAEWSTVDNDLILTSGRDSTLIAWRPSENMVDCTI